MNTKEKSDKLDRILKIRINEVTLDEETGRLKYGISPLDYFSAFPEEFPAFTEKVRADYEVLKKKWELEDKELKK